jgi:hypothetical protein
VASAANCMVAERYFRFTCDRGMWRYGITVIADVALRCKLILACALLEMYLQNTSWFEIISTPLRTSLVLVQENAISSLYCTTQLKVSEEKCQDLTVHSYGFVTSKICIF